MKIQIDDDLIAQLSEYQKETSFKKIDELIHYILSDYLDSQNGKLQKDTNKEILRERLKNLGYL